MTRELLKLPAVGLDALRKALARRLLTFPVTETALERVIGGGSGEVLAAELNALAASGFDEARLAQTLELVVADRAGREASEEPGELVISGPECPGTANRDTAMVIRELFESARSTVLIAGFVVYQGQRVFESLAAAMRRNPELKVTMVLDLQRGNSTSPPAVIVSQFAERFRTRNWPADTRLPDVWFDPRSLSTDQGPRSSMHAKCIVVDDRDLFVTSANFTEAAQERNIEVGVRVHSPSRARQLSGHFQALISARVLQLALRDGP